MNFLPQTSKKQAINKRKSTHNFKEVKTVNFHV